MTYPKYSSGMVIFSSDPTKYICHICHNDSTEPLDQHLQQERHRLNLQYFWKYFYDYGAIVHCKTCKTELPLVGVIEHAKGHELTPWHSNNDVEVQSTESEDIVDDEIHIIAYICRVCKAEVTVDDMKSHMNLHKNKPTGKNNNQSGIKRSDINDNVKSTEVELVDLTVDNPNEEIIICDESRIIEIEKDLEVCDDQSIIYESTSSTTSTSRSSPSSQFDEMPVDYSCSTKTREKSPTEPTDVSSSRVEIKFTMCNICKWAILGDSANILNHTMSHAHMQNLQLLSPNTQNRTVTIEAAFTPCNNAKYFMIESNVESDANLMKILTVPLNSVNCSGETFYWCNACDMKLSSQPRAHLRSEEHARIFHKIEPIVGSKYLTCRTCDFSKFIPPQDIMEHINTSAHQKNLLISRQQVIKNMNFESIQQYLPRNNLPDGIEMIEGESFFLCTVCNSRISDLGSIEEHIKDATHGRNITNKFIINIRETVFACLVCMSYIRSLPSLEEHLSDQVHTAKLGGINVFDLEKAVNQLLKPMNIHEINKYSCSLCDIRLEGDPVIPLEHTFGKRHQSLLMKESLASKSATSSQSHHLHDYIQRIAGNGWYFCTLCKCRIPGSSNVQLHVRGKSHRDRSNCTVYIEKTYGLATEYILNPALKNDLPEGVEWISGEHSLFCTICNSWIAKDDSIDDHIVAIDHAINRPTVIRRCGDMRFECVACKSGSMDLLDTQKHLKNSNHWSNKEAKFPASLESNKKRSDVQSENPVLSPVITSSRSVEKHGIDEIEVGKRKTSLENEKCNNPETIANSPEISSTIREPGNNTVSTDKKNGSTDQIAHNNPSVAECLPDGIESLPKEKTHCAIEETQSMDDHVTTTYHGNENPKVVASSLSKMNEQPMEISKVSEINDKSETLCSLCDKELEFDYELQRHLMDHFWPECAISCSMETEDNSKHSSQSANNLKGYLRKQSLRCQRAPLDVDIGYGVNIYELDKYKEISLHQGLLVIVVVDVDILYCLICRKTIDNCILDIYDHLCSIDHLDQQQLMIKDDQKFKKYLNDFALSDLLLANEYMEEVNDTSVNCHVCNTSVPNDISSLEKHIKDPSHIAHRQSALAETTKIALKTFSSMRCNFYSVSSYSCVLCKLKFSIETEFRNHLLSTKHIQQIQMLKDIKEKLIFDHCVACATLWFGFLRTYGYHSKCQTHTHHAGNSFYLITELPGLANQLLQSVEGNVERLLKEVDNLRAENTEKRNRLILDLESTSKNKYPSCVAYLFDSQVIGLGGDNSHVDIFLECDTNEYPSYEGQNSSAKEVEERLMVVKSCLMKHPDVWLICSDEANDGQHIIKAQHLPTKMHCNISFTNGLSVESLKLVEAYCEKFANCRRMTIFVRNWMHHCELTEINSYTIAWMVIFFLQVKGILPSVAQLIAKKKQSRPIGGWETGVDLDFEITEVDKSIEKLLTEFFAFYADFDYRNEIISPLLARSVAKTDFQKRSRIPAEMERYVVYLECGEDAEPLSIDAILCIQHPFDLSHNITKSITKNSIHRLRSFCSITARSLANR